MVLIGAAFPRTGTMSVKTALERLGVGRCYHMHEVSLNPEHVEVWNAVHDGRMPDWRTFLSGYAATLDVPACLYWKELAETFPNAKVLFLRRDPEGWYESMLATTYQVVTGSKGQTEPPLAMVKRVLFEGYFEGRFEDRDHAIATYLRYCDEVRQCVSADRLLEYEVSQGWRPLCDLLKCPVPEEPFPRTNTRDSFRSRNRMG